MEKSQQILDFASINWRYLKVQETQTFKFPFFSSGCTTVLYGSVSFLVGFSVFMLDSFFDLPGYTNSVLHGDRLVYVYISFLFAIQTQNAIKQLGAYALLLCALFLQYMRKLLN